MRGLFLGIPHPCLRPGLYHAHPPDRFPLKIGGEKRVPVQEMSAGRPQTGAGRGLGQKNPPRPGVGAGPDE